IARVGLYRPPDITITGEALRPRRQRQPRAIEKRTSDLRGWIDAPARVWRARLDDSQRHWSRSTDSVERIERGRRVRAQVVGERSDAADGPEERLPGDIVARRLLRHVVVAAGG